MEKQLLLKEAATRKRLLALKQQLQADNGIHSTNKLITRVRSEASNKTADYMIPKTAQSEKLHTTEHEATARLSMSMNGNWPTRLSVKSQPSQAPPLSSTTTTANTTTSTKNLNNGVNHDKSSVNDEKKLKYKQSSFGRLMLDTATVSSTISTTDSKPEIVASMHQTKQPTSPSVNKKEVTTTTQSTSSTSSPNDRVNSKPVSRQRLAVPDTIKETEYMSAVTKQKARVSRIRKAIQAAVVIQRAWRKYKQNHMVLN